MDPRACFYRTSFFIILALLLAAPADTWADTLTYAGPPPDPGITKCYDNDSEITCPQPGEDYYGQDAQFIIHARSYTKYDAIGAALPDNAAAWAMVRDGVTGLMWENKSDNASCLHTEDAAYTWQNAQDNFIAQVNIANFGGRNNWRLPTFKELATLVDSGRHSPAIDPTYFPNTGGEYYWTASSFAQDSSQAWLVFFGGGESNYNAKTNAYRVRAVSGLTAGPFDDTFSYLDNGDGTISDTQAGLMWQKDMAPGHYSWKQALAYCYTLTLADYTDWRLPDKNELHVLANYARYNPARDITAFPNLSATPFWTASTNDSSIGYAFLVDFYFGSLNNGDKKESYDVRAVRTASNGSFTYVKVLKDGTGSGSVASADGGINCGTDCAQTYETGTLVTLTATPDAGSGFTGWSYTGCNDLGYTGDCVVQGTGGFIDSVTATFSTCTDSDSDSFLGGGRGCEPQDCDDSDPTINDNCTRCSDNDSDGYGEGPGCIAADCNDNDTNLTDNCTSCSDADGDGHYAGPGCTPQDCNDSDVNLTDNCTVCTDADDDGYGEGPGCIAADCNDNDTNLTDNCTSCSDADSDGYYAGPGCTPQDCNDSDVNLTDNCTVCTDADGDGYGEGPGCIAADCNDNDTNLTDNCTSCSDADSDGYFIGSGCTPQDCDDTDPDLTDTCTTCSIGLQPAKISKLVSLLFPIRRIVISSQDGGVFSAQTAINWGTDKIDTLTTKLKGQTTIIAWVRIKPLLLEVNETFAVTTGGCSGTLSVRGF